MESLAAKPLSCGHIRMSELVRRLPPVKSKKRKSMCQLPPFFRSFPFRLGFLLCPHSFTKLFFAVSDTGNCQLHVSEYALFQDNGTDKMRRTNNGFFTARTCPFLIIRFRPFFCDSFAVNTGNTLYFDCWKFPKPSAVPFAVCYTIQDGFAENLRKILIFFLHSLMWKIFKNAKSEDKELD